MPAFFLPKAQVFCKLYCLKKMAGGDAGVAGQALLRKNTFFKKKISFDLLAFSTAGQNLQIYGDLQPPLEGVAYKPGAAGKGIEKPFPRATGLGARGRRPSFFCYPLINILKNSNLSLQERKLKLNRRHTRTVPNRQS